MGTVLHSSSTSLALPEQACVVRPCNLPLLAKVGACPPLYSPAASLKSASKRRPHRGLSLMPQRGLIFLTPTQQIQSERQLLASCQSQGTAQTTD